MTSPSDDADIDIYPAAFRQAQQEQAARLQDAAARAGLDFEAYLAPEAACWALRAIEAGHFISPSELAWVAIQQFIDMQQHPDLREELLRRQLQAAMDDPRPGIPAEEVMARLKARIAERALHEPARWIKPDPATFSPDGLPNQ